MESRTAYLLPIADTLTVPPNYNLEDVNEAPLGGFSARARIRAT